MITTTAPKKYESVSNRPETHLQKWRSFSVSSKSETKLKMRLIRCYVLSLLYYGMELWKVLTWRNWRYLSYKCTEEFWGFWGWGEKPMRNCVSNSNEKKKIVIKGKCYEYCGLLYKEKSDVGNPLEWDEIHEEDS